MLAIEQLTIRSFERLAQNSHNYFALLYSVDFLLGSFHSWWAANLNGIKISCEKNSGFLQPVCRKT